MFKVNNTEYKVLEDGAILIPIVNDTVDKNYSYEGIDGCKVCKENNGFIFSTSIDLSSARLRKFFNCFFESAALMENLIKKILTEQSSSPSTPQGV